MRHSRGCGRPGPELDTGPAFDVVSYMSVIGVVS